MKYPEKWVLEQANLRKEIWEDSLASYFEDFELEIVGALKTGLYHGPKNRLHSPNVDCPSRYRQVIEVDLRLILGRQYHPHDQRVITAVEKLTGLASKKQAHVKRWHRNTPITFLYKYEELCRGLALEWELCINQEPYLETSLFWRTVFSEEEIEFQKKVRVLARKNGCDYFADFVPLKEAQAAEARWRIVSSYAMSVWMASQGSQFIDGISSTPPLTGTMPSIVEPLVKMWLLGQTGISPPDRPNSKLANSLYVKVCKSTSFVIPPEPNWVTLASEIQKNICEAPICSG